MNNVAATALTSHASIEQALASLEPVSLEEMDGAALLDRRDTKFVLDEAQAAKALHSVGPWYRVLEVNGTRIQAYRTLYFDSPGLALYHAHHRRQPGRYKVRSRLYVETGTAFLEVKRKVRANRTVKTRTRTPDIVSVISEGERDFVSREINGDGSELAPQLINEFRRVTLVDHANGERVTLDLGVRVGARGSTAELTGVVIAEVKESGAARDSVFLRQMRAMNIHPSSFSKYCIGIALLRSDVKHNQFKPELRRIESILSGASHGH